MIEVREWIGDNLRGLVAVIVTLIWLPFALVSYPFYLLWKEG